MFPCFCCISPPPSNLQDSRCDCRGSPTDLRPRVGAESMPGFPRRRDSVERPRGGHKGHRAPAEGLTGAVLWSAKLSTGSDRSFDCFHEAQFSMRLRPCATSNFSFFFFFPSSCWNFGQSTRPVSFSRSAPSFFLGSTRDNMPGSCSFSPLPCGCTEYKPKPPIHGVRSCTSRPKLRDISVSYIRSSGTVHTTQSSTRHRLALCEGHGSMVSLSAREVPSYDVKSGTTYHPSHGGTAVTPSFGPLQSFFEALHMQGTLDCL
ncbi:hypothetical protein VTN31DRAFT_3572 [Thermomyces dupontii]|uniref:uncharacterized protein n=1 Tax=Talaromyces thermophilus TaxID=28565 RepID=UPI00374322AA